MRHKKIKHRIGTTSAHRRSLLRNLASEIIDHEKIKTTQAKCKAVRPFVEKLITLAKKDTVANRRMAFRRLGQRPVVKKLFEEVAPRYKERPGGYTRILKLSDKRIGDNAPMGFIALVD